MTLYERIDELAKKQKISVFDLSLKLGMGRNAIYQWKKSVPNVEAVQKVADYFNVTVDYLLGRTDNKYLNANKEADDNILERALDSAMSYDGKGISDADRPIIKNFIKAYLESKDK